MPEFNFAVMIALTGPASAELIVRIAQGHVLVCYDRKGCLKQMREAPGGHLPAKKPKADETVFRVTGFDQGEATFKSAASHCGYFSINGQVYWSTIWDDAGPAEVKKCSFQEWVDECAMVLAGCKATMR